MGRVVVVGGGVSGLAVAFELTQRAQRFPEPVEVLCFEAGYSPGGSVVTERSGEFLLESGPGGFREASPGVRTLLRRLSLTPRRVVADPGASTYHIFRAGKLRRLPASARELLVGDVLSPAARLRVLAEPLSRVEEIPEDESIEAFAVRRLGRAAGTLLADALAAAVCSGDSRRLSMLSLFPRLRSMESDHGSLFRALRVAPAGGTSTPLSSFAGGLAELTRALAGKLGGALRLGNGVCAVSDMGERGYRAVLEEGPSLDADAIVLACPASDAAAVVGDWDPELGRAIGEIPAARVARVHLGYREAACSSWPGGAGFVVPREQGLRMLETEWTSNIFPGRAPAQSRLVTVTFGGSRDPGALELDDEALVKAARAELGRTMGLVVAPYMARVARPSSGIPQYEIGHAGRLLSIDRRLEQQPGLRLSGCSYRALDPGTCVEEASRIAETVLAHVAGRSVAVC